MEENASANAKTSLKSLVLKADKKTYFFDIKFSDKSQKKYLKITESSFEGEGKDRKYNTFYLFPEKAQEFQQRLSESLSYLGR